MGHKQDSLVDWLDSRLSVSLNGPQREAFKLTVPNKWVDWERATGRTTYLLAELYWGLSCGLDAFFIVPTASAAWNAYEAADRLIKEDPELLVPRMQNAITIQAGFREALRGQGMPSLLIADDLERLSQQARELFFQVPSEYKIIATWDCTVVPGGIFNRPARELPIYRG